jgi:hypothetical protein
VCPILGLVGAAGRRLAVEGDAAEASPFGRAVVLGCAETNGRAVLLKKNWLFFFKTFDRFWHKKQQYFK